MKRLQLSIGVVLVLVSAQLACADWCVTVTDANCEDAEKVSYDFTLPEESSLYFRYDTGSPDCCVDVEVWFLDSNSPSLLSTAFDLSNCGVFDCNVRVKSGHDLRFLVLCHKHDDYTGNDQPCVNFDGQVKFFYYTQTLQPCNTQCIPD